MRRSLMSGGVTLATLVLASGCGGSSSSDQTAKFKAGLSPVVNQFGQVSMDVGTAITKAPSQTDGQIAATFHDLATRWQNQLSQLETLKPPSNLAADFNTLTAAATRAETDLNAVVTAAETHSRSAATQASASMVTDIAAAKAASTTLTDKLGIK